MISNSIINKHNLLIKKKMDKLVGKRHPASTDSLNTSVKAMTAEKDFFMTKELI